MKTTSSPDKVVLQFEQALISAAEANRQQLETMFNRLIWAIGLIFTVAGIALTFFNIRTMRDIRRAGKQSIEEFTKNFKHEYSKTIEGLISGRVDNLVAIQNDRIKRTRDKLGKGLDAINRALLKSDDKVVQQLCPTLYEIQSSLVGKHILWIDDDEIGVNIHLQILQHFGVHVDIKPTTDDGIAAFKRSSYDLVVTNMMRDDDPCPRPAGVTLAKKIRQINDHVPIVVFTRMHHKTCWSDNAKHAGVNSICGDQEELNQSLKQHLVPLAVSHT